MSLITQIKPLNNDTVNYKNKKIKRYGNTIVIKNKYNNRSVIYSKNSRTAKKLIKKVYLI